MAKGNYAKVLEVALEMAGYQLLKRRANSVHTIYRCPGKPTIIVPKQIDDPKLFHKLRKLTEAQPS